MQKLRQITRTPNALDRLLGEEVRILQREPVFINSHVRTEYLKVNLSIHNPLSEDGGRLCLFPIEDNQFCLHLVYLMPDQVGPYQEICWVQFLPEFFLLFDEALLKSHTPFRFDQVTEQQFNVCAQTKTLIEQMRTLHALTPLLQSLQLSEMALQLLRKAIENVTVPFAACPVPACRFLANDAERDKIVEARRIVEQTIDQPLTIKELSRKVAMNECYLKKGFKTITGKTINEYQQDLRIAKAKELLQQQGQTVSDVASLLGYSSISHFSTAFKKATGMKPCELLG